MIRPPGGKGTGYGIAQHTFSTPGLKTVRFCILANGSDGECLTSHVTPELLVSLGIELPDDQGETPPPPIPAGEAFTIDVVIGNLQPVGLPGLSAQAMALNGQIDTPGLVFTGSSEGQCTISANGQTIDCAFGNFVPGEQRTLTLSFASDPELVLEDVDASVRLRLTTATDAINEVTEAYVTRTLLNINRLFSDRFQQH